jgi:ABC-2 type transport system ATP-binding protein
VSVWLATERAEVPRTARWGGRVLTRADRLAFGYMPEQRGLYPKIRVRDHLADLARLHGLTTGHAAGACDRWLRRAGIGVKADGPQPDAVSTHVTREEF